MAKSEHWWYKPRGGDKTDAGCPNCRRRLASWGELRARSPEDQPSFDCTCGEHLEVAQLIDIPKGAPRV